MKRVILNTDEVLRTMRKNKIDNYTELSSKTKLERTSISRWMNTKTYSNKFAQALVNLERPANISNLIATETV